MIRSIILSLVLIVSMAADAAIGDWRLHTSYHNATRCETIDGKVYVLASGALFTYSEEDEELRTFDKISHLSDIDISLIAYSKENEALVIVYKNANIDIFYDDESVYNISDFKNKTLATKNINSISINGNTALLSTGFGIVELDIARKEFTNTYTLNKEVYCAKEFKGAIYAGTKDGVVCGDRKENLLDNSNWKQMNNYKTTLFETFKNELYCVIENLGIYTLDTQRNRLTLLEKNNGTIYKYMYNDGTQLITGGTDKVIFFDSSTKFTIYPLEKGSNFIRKKGNRVWNCKGYSGLVPCAIESEKIVEKASGIIPNCPIRNYSEFIKFSGDKLLVAGGNINYLDTKFYEGTAMVYDYDNDHWTNLPEEIIKSSTGVDYLNVCSIDEDPTEENHYFASSFGFGLYEFRDGKFVKHYSNKNSALESVITGQYDYRYIRLPKIEFDTNGNLWTINTGTKTPIKILMKDGSWNKIYYQQLDKLPTVSDITIDSRGWLWVVSLQSDAGLFCAKINGTALDTSDDEVKTWFNKFTNQDGIGYDIYQIYAFTEDRNGALWVGTNTGLFVIDNPKKFFEDGRFTQIKVPRNDGTGLADYLMSGVYIQSILVDGANRKWIGTKHNGVYLISADGLETIHHFTTENSPLPSNSIMGIAINEKSGEVFFGTENGIASFIADATEPFEQLDESNVYAYPNPVRPDYSGEISIVGLTFDCNVKIVDTAGSLIFEGTSVGGSFKWDGRNKKGDRVAAGVYYVLAYDQEGNEGVATKILFIR